MSDRPLPRPRPAASPTINLGDIYYIFFRQKWKILAISILGIVTAVILPLIWNLPYQSEAKLFIRYVLETKSPGQMGANDSRMKSPDERGENVINTELEILTSLDLAQQVADAVGPQKILAKYGGGSDRYAAATVIHKNIEAEVPKKSNVIRIVFHHPDPEIVQPVLNQLIETYLKKHAEIHRSVGVFDDFLTQETDQLRSRLVQTEDELRKAKTRAGVFSIEDSKKVFTEQNSKIQQAIFDAEAELAERQASVTTLANLLHTSVPSTGLVAAAPARSGLGSVATNSASVAAVGTNTLTGTNGGATMAALSVPAPQLRTNSAPANLANNTVATTNDSSASAPPDKIAEYRRLSASLDTLQKKRDELLGQFTSGSSMVKPTEARIAETESLKAALEEEFPILLALPSPQPKAAEVAGFPPNPRADLTAEIAKVSALEAKIRVLTNELASIRTNAVAIDMAEGSITELQRKKELEEAHYKYFAANLEQSRIDEALGAGRVSNISKIQAPSPPFKDTSKFQKIRAMVLFGSIAAALAAAFLIETYLDRSVKRAGEVEAKLGLPLFISVPLICKNGKTRLLNGKKKTALLTAAGSSPQPQVDYQASDIANPASGIQDPPSTSHLPSTLNPQLSTLNGHLRPFSDALRDRLITFFEVNNLTHKPKLVALTSCAKGSGVSTLATGLAASLSETGDGNVLLVDMNHENGATQDFHRGKVACGLDEALEVGKRGDALIRDNLYMVRESGNGIAANGANGDKLPRVLPRRFNHLMPRLRASDYDYIIFDMPPINQISVTPRLARFMDMVLVVVESEKTDRDFAKRALSLISDPKPNLGVVLNKGRGYVPRLLHQDV